MAIIKSYTDLEQSKRLAEILPLESADMGWNVFVDDTTRILPIDDWDLTKDGSSGVKFFHAWSLAALLGVLRETNISTRDRLNKIRYSCWNDYDITYADNPIDACYNMILKLQHK